MREEFMKPIFRIIIVGSRDVIFDFTLSTQYIFAKDHCIGFLRNFWLYGGV